MRILIWFLVYMSVVIGLPRIPAISDLIATTDGLSLNARLIACAIAAAVGLIILILSRKHAAAGLGRMVFYSGFGLFGGGAWGVLEYISDQFPRLEYLILLPLAFVLSEALLFLFDRLRGKRAAPTSNTETDTHPRTLRRVIIYVLTYGLVVFVLPQQNDIAQLLALLDRVHPTLAFWLHVAAIPLAIAAVLGPALLLRNPLGAPDDPDAMYTHWRFQLVIAGAMGLLIAAAFGLFSRLMGGGLFVQELVLIPIGFIAAEAVFLIVSYRLEKGPYES